MLGPQRSDKAAVLVESVWPLLMHTTNNSPSSSMDSTASRLTQEQVGRVTQLASRGWCALPAAAREWPLTVLSFLPAHTM